MASLVTTSASHHRSVNRFESILESHDLVLRRGSLHTLQINVGRKCNQACRHCHVDAAPWRTEMMSESVAVRIGDWLRKHPPAVLDITGGAPELSEHFRYFVELGRELGCRVIDRNNLTIIETPAFGWLPQYLSDHDVEVVASLPCYLEENVDAQRGDGVFTKSIAALKKLNAVGYGTRLALDLVYNPLGAKLPPPQAELEADYKAEFSRRYGINFTRLYTITNQPIARFADDLRQRGEWDAYLELLANSFNPSTVEAVMCRNTLSVGWGGELFDCDFNQMLEMRMIRRFNAESGLGDVSELEKVVEGDGKSLYLWDITPQELDGAVIQTGVHCLACTAGSGSSCTGAVA